jgi:type II secretion system (T2SS) protein G
MICGYLALRRAKQSSGPHRGRGFAIAGLVISFFALVALALYVSKQLEKLPTLEGLNRVPELVLRGKEKRMKVCADIEHIREKLKLYESMNGFLPTTKQGLEALVSQPEIDPRPMRWRQLLDEVPKDPW